MSRLHIVCQTENQVKLEEPVEIECSRFYCMRLRVTACCRACPLRRRCKDASKNHPSRCGLMADN